MKSEVLLIGGGYMGQEYAKVLNAMDVSFEVVGRTQQGCKDFRALFPDVIVHEGGLDKYLSGNKLPDNVIVAVSVEQLYETTLLCLNTGVKNILLEKPGSNYRREIKHINDSALAKNTAVYLAYNRRFYSSVEKAREIIQNDGGILSGHFEFTEWIHTIDQNKFGVGTLNKWIIGNSTHVIDLFFHLCGTPKELHAQVTSGKGIDWHSTGSIFTGSGMTEKDIAFTYHSNWEAPGRWSVELLTSMHRLYFRPMEKLFIQNRGSVVIEECEINDKLDTLYKPGLYKQVAAFIGKDIGEKKDMCAIQQHLCWYNIYMKMGGYLE